MMNDTTQPDKRPAARPNTQFERSGTPESQSPVTPPAKKPEKKSSKGCFLGCGGVILVAIIIGVASTCSVGSSNWEPTEWEAEQHCQDWVKDKLKSPATAKFTDVMSRSDGTASWAVSGNVDAQNSFGALVRNSWTCSVRWDNPSELWRGGAIIHD
jgi:hypothetical protein